MQRSLFRLFFLGAVSVGLLGADARADVAVAIGDLAPGESVRISFDVTIDDPLTATTTEIAQQVTVSFTGGSVLSDDPETASPADATITALADEIAPLVVSLERQTPAATPAISDTLTFRVTFDEAVQQLDAADFVVTGTTALVDTITPISGAVYDLTLAGGDLSVINGRVTIAFDPAQDIADLAGNPLADTAPLGANDNYFDVTNNDAPVLVPAAPNLPPLLSTDTESAGHTIAALAGPSISDADSGALVGIGVFETESSHGLWQFSTDDGASWSALAVDLAEGRLLLLRATDRVRFVPDGLRGENPALSYLAWDQTGGTFGTQGTFVPLAEQGGSSPYSIGSDTVALTVVPAEIGTYRDWLIANFTGAEREQPEIVGMLQDPDGAGVANLVRYALDLPARGPVPPPTTWTTVEEGGVTYQALQFNVRRTAPGLTYFVEASTDLVTWTPVSVWYANSTTVVVARDAVALGAAPRRFLRLKVKTDGAE